MARSKPTGPPERQAALVAALEKASREIFASQPGFLSANLHTSLDGKRVIINYAQWSSRTLCEQALQRDEVREHIAEVKTHADSFDLTMAQVRSIHHPADAR